MPGKSRLARGLAGSAAALLLCVFAAGAHAIGASNPPTNVTPPVITGTPQAGQTLTCVPGAWNGTVPITYDYQWSRDGSPIGGEIGTSHVVVDADANRSLTCTERATNYEGSASATSAAVVPVTVGSPVPLPPAGGDTTAPVLTNFTATPTRAPLYVVKKNGRGRVRVYRRQVFKFGLSEVATVVITVVHRGRTPNHMSEPGGSMAKKLPKGEQRLRSAPSIGYFRMGKYTITAQATDAAGNRSAVAKATLRITKPRR